MPRSYLVGVRAADHGAWWRPCPPAQGVEVWVAWRAGNLSVLADEYALPFANALFDRVLVIHALEEADDPAALLREVWRVTAPSGRIILAAANRHGFWSDAEATPFGHGRPFTRRQLESLAQDASLEPAAWSRALFAPPLPWAAAWADGFEVIGARLCPGLSGLILLEAVKHSFAVRRKVSGAPAKVCWRPGPLNPAPAREKRRKRLSRTLVERVAGLERLAAQAVACL